MGLNIRNILRAVSLALPLAAGTMAFGPVARAEGEGDGAFMEDRVAEVLMQQAAAARMAACEAVLTPLGRDGTYRLTYRIVRPGDTMIARPANGMTAIILTDACRR